MSIVHVYDETVVARVLLQLPAYTYTYTYIYIGDVNQVGIFIVSLGLGNTHAASMVVTSRWR